MLQKHIFLNLNLSITYMSKTVLCTIEREITSIIFNIRERTDQREKTKGGSEEHGAKQFQSVCGKVNQTRFDLLKR